MSTAAKVFNICWRHISRNFVFGFIFDALKTTFLPLQRGLGNICELKRLVLCGGACVTRGETQIFICTHFPRIRTAWCAAGIYLLNGPGGGVVLEPLSPTEQRNLGFFQFSSFFRIYHGGSDTRNVQNPTSSFPVFIKKKGTKCRVNYANSSSE